MDYFGFPPVGVFAFVILLVLIGSLFQYLEVRSNNQTIRTLAQSGQPLDPSLIKHLGRERSGGGPGGLLLAGTIIIAVAIGLYIFGQQIGAVENEPETTQIFVGIAAIPGAVGVALFLGGLVKLLLRRKDDSA